MNLKQENLGMKNPFKLVKIVLVGDPGVGKTCLLTREYDDSYSTNILATVGIDFRVKIYDASGSRIKAQIWDSTTWCDKFPLRQRPYYRIANMFCLCFALNNPNSLTNLNKRMKQFIEVDFPKDSLFLIGCKSDLADQISKQQINQFAQQQFLQYYETSSVTGAGVHQTFQEIIQKWMVKQSPISEPTPTTTNISKQDNHNKNGNSCW